MVRGSCGERTGRDRSGTKGIDYGSVVGRATKAVGWCTRTDLSMVKELREYD